ncbi:MAG: hypothetical protein DMF74_02340 [Acidobacteria bacterium]|nr:MAG: hypothetical protein DMF74_02340 [Acidobacteriota bacterium]
MVGLTPRPFRLPIAEFGLRIESKFLKSAFCIPRSAILMARVPGVGLLNRTCKSWVERHEVQPVR